MTTNERVGSLASPPPGGPAVFPGAAASAASTPPLAEPGAPDSGFASVLAAPPRRQSLLLSALLAVALVYIFLAGVGMLSDGFKLLGKGFATALVATTANPFVGLFIGLLATAIVQSSSSTTSMVVAFVTAGTLSIEHAVPIIMGANIGTTVTNTLVSLGHMGSRQPFQRALAAATVHDFFNVLCVILLLPLELATGFLQKTASAFSSLLFGSSALTFESPLKVVTDAPARAVVGVLTGLPKGVAAGITVTVGLILLVAALLALTKLLRSTLSERIEAFFHRAIGKSGLRGILFGVAVTAAVQSSSVTTSLLVPMAAAGALTLNQVFPITLGANIGTTVTALLAAMAGNVAGLTIAFVHLLFNVVGTLIFYPLPVLRRIPMYLAERLAALAAHRRRWAILYVVGAFFVLPGVLILVYRLW